MLSYKHTHHVISKIFDVSLGHNIHGSQRSVIILFALLLHAGALTSHGPAPPWTLR